MRDFLRNEIHIGDFCVYIKNERTGSSTTRKIMKSGFIKRFTKKKIVFEDATVFPEDVVVVNNMFIQEVYELYSDSIIVVRFRYGTHPLETIKLIYVAISRCLPGHEVAMVPDDYSLEQMSEDGLIKIKEQINSILENKGNKDYGML